MRKKLLVCFGCALVFGWYGYLQWEMVHVQRAASRQIDEQRARTSQASRALSPPRALVIVPPRTGAPVGRIEIPRLHISVTVLEGTSPQTLKVAAGHVVGTALPGTTGNVGIAAHRDTFFRPLRDVRPKDDILVTTTYGTFRYVVGGVEIVDPTDVKVLGPTPDPELTLVTCYPFSYIGPAPQRFIIHARQQKGLLSLHSD